MCRHIYIVQSNKKQTTLRSSNAASGTKQTITAPKFNVCFRGPKRKFDVHFYVQRYPIPIIAYCNKEELF